RRLQLQCPPPRPSRRLTRMETRSTFVLDLLRAENVYNCVCLIGSAHVVVLAGPAAGRAAGVRSRTVHAPVNCAVGVYMAGAGYFLWWTLRLAGSSALFHSSNYGEVRRPTTAALVRARCPKPFR